MSLREQRTPKSLWSILGLAVATLAVLVQLTSSATSDDRDTKSSDNSEPTNRVTLEVARDRAKLMHDVYSSTLEVLHHRYFHGDRAIVPARAMEDVFSDIKQQSDIEARWISVNLKPMSINHEPKTDFEKQAAKEIAGGEKAVELIDEGFYRRAGAIPLKSGCVSCHSTFLNSGSSPKFAALVISIPIQAEEKQDE